MTRTSDAPFSACQLEHRNVIRPDASNRIYWTMVLIDASTHTNDYEGHLPN